MLRAPFRWRNRAPKTKIRLIRRDASYRFAGLQRCHPTQASPRIRNTGTIVSRAITTSDALCADSSPHWTKPPHPPGPRFHFAFQLSANSANMLNQIVKPIIASVVRCFRFVQLSLEKAFFPARGHFPRFECVRSAKARGTQNRRQSIAWHGLCVPSIQQLQAALGKAGVNLAMKGPWRQRRGKSCRPTGWSTAESDETRRIPGTRPAYFETNDNHSGPIALEVGLLRALGQGRALAAEHERRPPTCRHWCDATRDVRCTSRSQRVGSATRLRGGPAKRRSR